MADISQARASVASAIERIRELKRAADLPDADFMAWREAEREIFHFQAQWENVAVLLDELGEMDILARAASNQRELSSYAFNKYGNDAKLYNGVFDLESEVQRLKGAAHV